MLLIHDGFSQSEDFALIDFSQYIKKLIELIVSSYHVDTDRIKMKTHTDGLMLDIDAAIPCGLIINELLTNSLKYAFPQGEKGTVYLKIKAINDKYVLILRDNGVGLPPDFDLESTDTLGLRLVHNLVNQIDGELKVKNSKGTCFEIVFRELQYKKRI